MVLAQPLPGDFDRALVLRARAGDQEAFAELMQQYGATVRQLVYRFVQDSDDARDVEQDTWIRAATHLDSLRDEGRFRPWVKSIARHSALNFLAARKQQRARVSTFEDCGTEDFEDTSTQTPEAHTMSRDNQRKVWEALGSLSERDRTALFMREYQDQPYAVIAERLQISRNAAEVCVFRARDRFRRLFLEIEGRAQDCGLDPLRLSALIDGEMEPESAQALRDHVGTCVACDERLITMQAGQALYRNLGLFGIPLGQGGLLGSGGLLSSLGAALTKVVSLVTGGSGATAAVGGGGAAATATAATTATAVTATGVTGAAVAGGSLGAMPAVAGAIVVAVSSVVATGAILHRAAPPPAAPPAVVASAPAVEQPSGLATVPSASPTPKPGLSLVALTATPEPSPTPRTEPTPTPPPVVASTPASTPTPAPVVSTPAPTPSPTPSATPSATPSPTPSPTPPATPPPAESGQMASNDSGQGSGQGAPQTPLEQMQQSVGEAKAAVQEAAEVAHEEIEQAAEGAKEVVKAAQEQAQQKVANIETKTEAAKEVVVQAGVKIDQIADTANKKITETKDNGQKKVDKVEQRADRSLDGLERVASRVADRPRVAQVVDLISGWISGFATKHTEKIVDKTEKKVDQIATQAAQDMDETATAAETDAAAADAAGSGGAS